MSGYEPFNLTALQIGLESRGKQLRKDGKPVTSPKGATGISQSLMSTAQETAAKHGIPWDENKFKYDRDYNLQLGDLYQGELDKQFGRGSLAATAAYNAGPGRVSRLMAAHPNDWAQHLPEETKKYLKITKGVDVGSGLDGKSYYPDRSSGDSIVDATAATLNIPVKNYKVGAPGTNERTTGDIAPQVSQLSVQDKAAGAVTASDRYTQFLQNAVDPIVKDQAAILDRAKAITGIKRNIVNDFATREADLETKIRPLMEKRAQVASQLIELENMNPLDRRLKAIFNPNKYDPRMLRGQLERTNTAIQAYESNYSDLNTLRSGVAAASVDAETADQQALTTAAQNTLSQAQLLGQVRGAVVQNTGDQLFPLSTHVDTMKLQEATKAHLLGSLTTEKITSLFTAAKNSPDGFVMQDGVRLTVGDLQTAAQQSQGQELNFRNLVNAYKTNDLRTTDEMESHYIDHMTPEQITEAMKNGGQITGADGKPFQLSITKLTSALDSATHLRDTQVEGVVNKTAAGMADGVLRNLSGNIAATRDRATDMFGSSPSEYSGMQAQIQSNYQAWRKGFDALHGNDQAQSEYVAKTMPQIQSWQKLYDDTVTGIANKWGGGKQELSAVAESWLRGNPISGDAALKGLIIISRSGMPAGAQVSGPAAQALAVAKATVQEWDHPQAGDSADTLAQLMKGQSHKDSDLMRLVQQRVSAVYADGLADAVINDLPQLARGVRDPNDPTKLHPFARVNREDFIMSIRHGDASAYNIIGTKMGTDPNTAKRIFASGTESPEWKALAQKKGYSSGQFEQFYQALQATQMSETMSALDASHSAQPGFSPSKAYVDFLNMPEVANRVKQTAQGYGRSSFGSFLLSSSAGGGFQDAWDGYTRSVGAVYQQLHSKELQQRITQQRSIGGDPFVRFNAVNRASGLTPQESQLLLNAVRPIVQFPAEVGGPGIDLSESGAMASATTNASGQFDSIASIIRTHKFDDPTVEKLRKKVASQWDTLDALTGTVLDSVND